jgi:hypothetical protein
MAINSVTSGTGIQAIHPQQQAGQAKRAEQAKQAEEQAKQSKPTEQAKTQPTVNTQGQMTGSIVNTAA